MTAASPTDLRPRVVPYIVSWSAEDAAHATVVVRPRGGGIAYADETTADRDSRGVLWQREGWAPGEGRPQFRNVHGMRQRSVMRRLLCQVCARPAHRTDAGVLWLLPDNRDDWPGWPDGAGETAPPLCLPCAEVSRRLCPRLRGGNAAVRVQNPELAGVRGIVHRSLPGAPATWRTDAANLRFDDPRLPWTVAHQLVRRLLGCTLVDLDTEIATRS